MGVKSLHMMLLIPHDCWRRVDVTARTLVRIVLPLATTILSTVTLSRITSEKPDPVSEFGPIAYDHVDTTLRSPNVVQGKSFELFTSVLLEWKSVRCKDQMRLP